MTKRERVREKLSPLYLPYYDNLCRLLPPEWQPYCGLRTFQEQAELYEKGRSTTGKIVTNARAGDSPHNWGCATDWTIFDNNNRPDWEHGNWNVYSQAVKRAHLKWGGSFKSLPDRPHNELALGVTWVEVKKIYQKDGMEQAILFIKANIIV